MAEDKYVLRHEWENSRGKIHQRINDVDKKHTDSYNQLLNKVDQQTLLQQKSFESQEKSEKHLEKISESLTTVGTRVTDLEYKTQAHGEKITSLQGQLDAEMKGNRDVLIKIIGTAGVVIVPLIGLVAQLFR
ncbi:hypothetical protein [Staphylococcus gallinarum]|uniref:Uncharacterized protein n=1 Tax=Staphylococcus gallinarum TaxID=1293 RepID=A0A2T4SZV2_STAGA|nr:hypothetical protein [Staphylococcus gallinarum]MBU7217594.1 hypothetical protein [Staphylococcus gallinarum]MCD8872140.1 hypothetical protein [Staphylococcus gallinarum]PTE75907.1 hypothetical protein BUY96_09300 [Staphylococcus gallinarum]PTL11122.1 hypothetical protein BUZ15_04880 [Staphylococcus gallinarum]RIL28184.1 hypothetical protein BUY98_13885 [Staphylococcus gallinarum]